MNASGVPAPGAVPAPGGRVRPSQAVRRWAGRFPRTLRSRATLAFTLVAAALTTILVIGVWLSVSQYLLLQRERFTLGQTLANVAQVQRGLGTSGLSVAQLLSQLPRETGSTSLLVDDGEWSTTSLRIGREDLPVEFRDSVLTGQPSQQRITVDGEAMLVIGIPLAGIDDAYVEVFPLQELDNTYRVLGLVLTLAALAVVPVSLLIGWWVTRPTLRPLARLSTAAAAIAEGNLSVRIDPRNDPSLVPIAESFNATAAALEHRVRSDARFSADVSHELRSPLTTMLSAMALVEVYEDRLPEDGREGLALLRSEVHHFERLVADLLEISRADVGSSDMVLEDVRLAALVQQSLSRRLPAGTGVEPRVTVDSDASDVVVHVDKRRLERVISNLIDNADKHGGGLTAVTVERSDTVACVIVDDHGAGVPEHERGVIFERFARGGGSVRTSTEGSGLGLALVTRHVQMMGGTVLVTDNPNGGARFVVRLPVDGAG